MAGLISGWAYTRNNTIRLKMDVLISGGLKTGGGDLKVGFYDMSIET